MFKIIMKLFPKKWIVEIILSNLPTLLTKGLEWLGKEHPDTLEEVKDSVVKLNKALNTTLEAIKDGEIDRVEMQKMYVEIVDFIKSLFEKINSKKKLTP